MDCLTKKKFEKERGTLRKSGSAIRLMLLLRLERGGHVGGYVL
jgi:hypothetical protein